MDNEEVRYLVLLFVSVFFVAFLNTFLKGSDGFLYYCIHDLGSSSTIEDTITKMNHQFVKYCGEII